MQPAREGPGQPLWAPTYRLLGYCVVVGVLGGIAALVFEAAVELAQRLLLGGVGGYTPPESGVLDPEVQVPGWPERWWLPVATTLGGLLSGLVVYRWAPEAEGHGTDAAISAYHARGGDVRPRTPLVKAVASALTIGSGGVFAPTITLGAMLGAALGTLVATAVPQAGFEPASFVLVGMAAVFAGAARTPISTLIMVAEMTGGYGLIVPAMLTNTLAFVVQRSLTAGRRYPTLYEHQVPAREDSAAHRGVFVRRALQMLEGDTLEPSEIALPRLVSLLRFGEPIQVAEGSGMLVTLEVGGGSALDGATVAEAFAGVDGGTAVSILRAKEMVIPRGPTPLQAGDQLVAIATPEAFALLREAAAPRPDPG